MNKLKVTKVESESLTFNDGTELYSQHSQDCCESHYISFGDVTLEDFEGLEFDLSGEDFFKRVEGYGIELIPIVGHPVRVPGYGYNNGYYGSDINLVIHGNGVTKSFDVSECQVISG